MQVTEFGQPDRFFKNGSVSLSEWVFFLSECHCPANTICEGTGMSGVTGDVV